MKLPWHVRPRHADARIEKLRKDPVFFVRELFLEFDLLKFGEILEIEADMIRWAALGPPRRGILAYRGFGKTWMLTASLTCWRLFNDPDTKILIPSKAAGAAKDTVFMIRRWIDEAWWLKHLSPSEAVETRDKATGFDVAGSSTSRSTSVTAVGIESQLPNLRAHVIYADDVETKENTETADARQKLDARVREFDAIASYGNKEICFIGTYHHEESLYLALSKRGYAFRSYPVCLPGPEEPVLNLAPPIQAMVDAGQKPGTIVFPHRKSEETINLHQAEGRSHWLMQYILCSTVGDIARYPLRLEDLIVPDFDITPDASPLWIKWGRTNSNGQSTAREDIPNLGFTGDRIHRQIMFSGETKPMAGPVVFVDPSGRGDNETVAVVIGFLNGLLYVLALESWLDGYAPETLLGIARLAKRFRATAIHSEDNFGQGMFAQLLRPVVQTLICRPGEDPACPAGWVCHVAEPTRSSKQKELRICDTLEPVTQQHRVVVAPAILRHMPENDLYSFQKQFTRITRQAGSLKYDDKVDALAGGVAIWTPLLNIDPVQAATRNLEKAREARIRALNRKYRMPSNDPAWFRNHATRS